jgi:hypothetical protein
MIVPPSPGPETGAASASVVASDPLESEAGAGVAAGLQATKTSAIRTKTPINNVPLLNINFLLFE